MIIKGYTVPQSVIDAANARIALGDFDAGTITRVAVANGAPELFGNHDCAYRIADRLIQAARKRGEIKFVKGRWQLIGESK